MGNIKRSFGAGLLITIPIFFTLYILYTVFRFIDGICGTPVNFFLKKNLGFAIPGVGIILGIAVIFTIGFVATNFFGKKLFHLIEGWFLKLPIIKQIYPAAKHIVNSLISNEHPAFKKVVLVEYPSKGLWAVGFMTNDSFKEACEKTGEELVHVLIGTTPTPFSGFLILVPKKNIKILDISIEEGIKLVVTAGIVKP